MSDNVTTGRFGGEPYRDLGELGERLYKLVMEYEGRVPTLGAIGALELVKYQLLAKACD